MRPNTLQSYQSDIEAYVIPLLGSRQLQRLGPDELNALYSNLGNTGGRGGRGLAPKTIRNVHGVVHKALADAVRWGHIPRNPADLADPPAARKPELTTWTAEEMRVFLRSVEDDRLAALWTLGATTGMRRSELLGLRWRHVDSKRGDSQWPTQS